MLDCSKNTDKDIVELVSNGEIDAFGCLVEKYEEKLLKYIRRITNVDIQEAENILQEVFIKAYTKINSYNKIYSFSSWIYRIAHNHTIDYFKKNKNKQTVNIEIDKQNLNLLDLFESDENIEKKLSKKRIK